MVNGDFNAFGKVNSYRIIFGPKNMQTKNTTPPTTIVNQPHSFFIIDPLEEWRKPKPKKKKIVKTTTVAPVNGYPPVQKNYPLITTTRVSKAKGNGAKVKTLKKNGYRVVNGANGNGSNVTEKSSKWGRYKTSLGKTGKRIGKIKKKAGVVRRRGMRRLTAAPGKAEIKKSRKYRKAAIGMMGLMLPIETGHLTSGKKGGRPRGTYKHAIPGKGGVPVQQYRRWSAAQRRLQRMKDQQLVAMAQRGGPHTSTASPEGQAETMPEEMATRDTPTSYEEPEEVETTYEEVPQTPYRDVEQPGDYQEQQPSDYQEPPRSDNILNAPSISRGELRNERPKNPYKGPDDTAKPIVNPYGDYFTDVDPMTGKPLLQKRIRERWLAGDQNANTR